MYNYVISFSVGTGVSTPHYSTLRIFTKGTKHCTCVTQSRRSLFPYVCRFKRMSLFFMFRCVLPFDVVETVDGGMCCLALICWLLGGDIAWV